MFRLKKRKRIPVRTARQIFHGVAIKPGTGGCIAAQDLSRLRYLADDAPLLPLADCPNPAACVCTYEHFEDRRTLSRRDSDVGLPIKDHPRDIRSGVGRRVTDG